MNLDWLDSHICFAFIVLHYIVLIAIYEKIIILQQIVAGKRRNVVIVFAYFV